MNATPISESHDITNSTALFKLWGADGLMYGPVELPRLVDWIKDERITGDSWIYSEAKDSWQKASQMDELQIFFSASSKSPERVDTKFFSGIKPGSLRRVKILADLTDPQLQRFLQFMEVQQSLQWDEIVKQGDLGDAMYLILEGELRVRMMIDGRESILTTLSAGEFFGEMCLFDDAGRSADVVANQNSMLLKISAAAFQQLMVAAPDIAAPFLFNIGKTLVARIRADNKRYRDSIHFARAAGNGLLSK